MSEQETQEPEETQDVTADTTDVDRPEAPEATDENESDWRKDFDPDKAAARISKLQSESKNLRERVKTAEKKNEDVDSLTQANSSLALENTRLQVGYELGLPLALARRLQGGTRDEMLADADELLKIAGAGKAPAQRKPIEALRGGGQPEQEPEETDVDKIGARMFRN